MRSIPHPTLKPCDIPANTITSLPITAIVPSPDPSGSKPYHHFNQFPAHLIGSSSSLSVPLPSPHVHFPATPSLTSTYPAHSAAVYDRAPIVVGVNVCALPRRAQSNKRGRGRGRGVGRCGSDGYHAAGVEGSPGYFGLGEGGGEREEAPSASLRSSSSSSSSSRRPRFDQPDERHGVPPQSHSLDLGRIPAAANTAKHRAFPSVDDARLSRDTPPFLRSRSHPPNADDNSQHIGMEPRFAVAVPSRPKLKRKATGRSQSDSILASRSLGADDGYDCLDGF